MKLLTLTFTLSFFVIRQNGITCSILSLHGADWELSSADGRYRVPGATLPGDVYYELYRRRVVSDPYFRDNDERLRWIAKTTWTYRRRFAIADYDENARYLLVADGVDAVCAIVVNTHVVANTTNAFRLYRFDVSAVVRPTNLIELIFYSPILYAKEQHDTHYANFGYHAAAGSGVPPPSFRGEMHASYIRKMQSSFSWDWAPAFPTSGVQRRLHFGSFRCCTLVRSSLLPSYSKRAWNLRFDALLFCNHSHTLRGNLLITLHLENYVKVSLAHNFTIARPAGNTSEIAFSHTFRLCAGSACAKIRRWWPNGFGNQTLYDVDVAMALSSCSPVETLTSSTRVAFRTVELVQEAPVAGASGLTFYFRVNDVPVFLRGANWVPADAFETRIDAGRLDFLFASMLAANMNTIRVFGGATYEADRFYELADEFGLLVWQDFMFGCAWYPANREFLDDVAVEIADQVERLKQHASVLVWTGNNENEVGFTAGWFDDGPDAATMRRDYVKLFEEVVAMVARARDPTRSLVLSSPSNGKATMRENDAASIDPSDNRFGDKHHWTFELDAWTTDSIPLARCVTEYGIQSLPSLEAFETVLNEDDLDLHSAMMKHRQHHTQFYFFHAAYMEANFRTFPRCSHANESRACAIFGRTLAIEIFLSQINQAMIVQRFTEFWRRGRSEMRANGEGFTMCALYWQLNDVWPAPTWSSIDFIGRWKLLHYSAAKFFAPVLTSAYISQTGEQNATLHIYVVNDQTVAHRNVTIHVDAYRWSTGAGRAPYRLTIREVTIPRLSSRLVLRRLVATLVNRTKSQQASDVVLSIRTLDAAENELAPPAVVFTVPFKAYDPGLFGSVRVVRVLAKDEERREFSILLELSSRRIAPFVWLQLRGVLGHFSDNGFFMFDPACELTFTVAAAHRGELDAAKLERDLSVISLRDIYA